jgi:hypothetical protein
MVAKGYLSMDRTARGVDELTLLKLGFKEWADSFVENHPAVRAYYETVLYPEAGID